MQDEVRYSVSEHVATITLDRPPVNALTRQTYQALETMFTRAGESRDVRVVVFAAAGDRAFSAGVDLRALAEGEAASSPAGQLDRGLPIRRVLQAIGDCPVPVICALHGVAVGAGAGLVSMCDLILASSEAHLGFTEINVGLLGGYAHLQMMVGRYRARALFFTGELIGAAELHAAGMVHRVVDRERLDAEATALARTIASKSPIAVRLAKESIQRIDGLPLMDAYRIEQDYTNRLLGFEDAREARTAMLEKRAPRWQWK